MNNENIANSNEIQAPKQLHKPHREAHGRRPEEVVTYSADVCDDGYVEAYPELGY